LGDKDKSDRGEQPQDHVNASKCIILVVGVENVNEGFTECVLVPDGAWSISLVKELLEVVRRSIFLHLFIIITL